MNRLCASGLDAVGAAARAIKTGEMDLAIAGGVESMSRAPFVMGKATEAFSAHRRDLRHHHRLALHQPADEGSSTASIRCRRPARTWREEFQVTRADQDAFALRSQQRAGRAQRSGCFAEEIVAGRGARRQGRPDHRRQGRASARRHDAGSARQAEDPSCAPDGTVTAGNASGVNDGAAAMILASARGGRAARPDAARARARHGVGRRAAAHHGHRPGAGGAEARPSGSASGSATST